MSRAFATAATLLTTLAIAACTATSGTAQSGASAGRGETRHTSSGSQSSTPATTTSTTPDLTAHLSIGGTGDLLTHVAVRLDAQRYAGTAGSYDFAPMFADVKSLIEAPDVSICHMETPLTSTNTNLTRSGILVFNPPHELADAVRETGWEGCDFASNHTWDQGLAGLRDTIKVFEKARIGYAGAGPSADDPQRVQIYHANGLTIAHLGYAYTAFNDFGPNTDVPPEAPWLARSMWPVANAKGILADAKAARAAGADVVVVSLHWGTQYVTEPTADQRALAKELLSSPDVDLILGTHVHVVQPCEEINGKYVFYGMGNFLSNQSPQVDATLRPETQEGVIVRVDLQRDATGAITQTAGYRPTKVRLDGHVVEPATPQSNPVTFDRVTKTLTSLGCSLTTLP
ncbi:MAG: CapA family protein [Tetrasphaera sp.]|nr:CapA family protein [Tetrasphaera sp.]